MLLCRLALLAEDDGSVVAVGDCGDGHERKQTVAQVRVVPLHLSLVLELIGTELLRVSGERLVRSAN